MIIKDILHVCMFAFLLHCGSASGLQARHYSPSSSSSSHSSSGSSHSSSATSHSSSSGGGDDGGDDGGDSEHTSSTSSACHNCNCNEYNKVIAYRNSHDCTDENKLFPLLKALDDKSQYCRNKAINYMAGRFHSTTDTPSRCQCSTFNKFQDYRRGGSDFPFYCLPDRNFDSFFNHYFYHLGEPRTPPKCRTHHAMWSDLAKVSSSGSNSCQHVLVQHLGVVFKDSNPCSCSKAVHTNPPTTTATRSTTTTTKTTTTTTTTAKPIATTKVTQAPVQQSISVKYKCGKLSTVESIAIQHHVDQKNATLCGTSNRQGSDESFVLVNCDTPNPSEWKQGINVMQHCLGIPTYTPVATFIGGRYYSSLAESGVFMGCIPNGFKLGIQHCNGIPTIDHVLTSATGLQNADVFYTID